MYDPEGAQVWLQEIEKIFRLMVCIDAQKVLFGTHMLAEEAEYWLENAHMRLDIAGTEITWGNFKTNFLAKYLSVDVRSKKDIEFLKLKQGNIIVAYYAANLKGLSRLCPYYNGVRAE